jgi:hypothetical protein
MTAPISDVLIGRLEAEIQRQDVIHPDGYPATRDGIRLAIVTAEDELTEARDEWRAARCKCPMPRCGHADWSATDGELLQVVAVVLRAMRSIEYSPEPVSLPCTCLDPEDGVYPNCPRHRHLIPKAQR